MDSVEQAIIVAEPDWNEVQRRYLTGDELTSIAADCGTTPHKISQRAWRYGWKAQQFKLLEQGKKEVELEVRGCITISVLKEARAFQREDPPLDLALRDIHNKTRLRLLETASKLFGWSDDPLANAKPARCIEL